VQETAQTFVEQNASRHKKCHQKYNTSMLERARVKVSRKSKYHFTCLNKYRNRYRALHHAQACSHSSSSTSARAKAQALAELVVIHIGNNLEQGTHLFKLGELYADY